LDLLVLRPAGSITEFKHHVFRSLRFRVLCSFFCSLVLHPDGSITAFQHHVTRSLQRFHIGSDGSSPCWLDHCVSIPCNSITAAVPRFALTAFYDHVARSLRFDTMCLDHCGGSTLDLLVLRPAGSITALQHHVTRSLRSIHVGSPGSSPCWIDH
jgi:hypothetical protein